MNYPVDLETTFHIFVVTHVCLNFKPLKSGCKCCTKICDLIKNLHVMEKVSPLGGWIWLYICKNACK